MILKFKCRECSGKGHIPTPPSSQYEGWGSKRCERCDGQGYTEVSNEDQIDAPPAIGPDGLRPTPECNVECCDACGHPISDHSIQSGCTWEPPGYCGVGPACKTCGKNT